MKEEFTMSMYASKNDLIAALQSRIEALEKDAARHQLQKKYPHIKIDHFGGKFRAHCIHKILTDWVDSYDEAFDLAMEKEGK